MEQPPTVGRAARRKKGKVREYAEALVTALLAAFLIRSFLIEPFRIPSSSMVPTLLVGDHIFVNKYLYGLRIPFTKRKIVPYRDPARGEAVVFLYPLDEGKDFIKRVVGLPGDRIRLEGDSVLINGVAVEVKRVENGRIPDFPDRESFDFFAEVLDGHEHLMQLDTFPSFWDQEFVVPQAHLFVMGDNRDNSADSREWGFVPLENVKGKAMFIWLSIDFEGKRLRWERFGKWIH